MKKGLRAVFCDQMQATKHDFTLHVIGFNIVRNCIVDRPQGTECWFFHHFHTPVSLHTLKGIIKTKAHTFSITAPGEWLYHGLNSDWNHSWVRLSGRYIPTMVANSGLQTAFPYELGEDKESLNCLQAMYDFMNHPLGADEQAVRKVMELWLRRVKFLSGEHEHPIKPLPLLKVMRYVQRHYLEPLSLQELSQEAHLSISQLCRQFRKHLQTSPQAYVIYCRLAHARELLLTTSLNVSEIAMESGFYDVYYFSRMYKKHYGYPPSSERRHLS